MHGFPNTQIQKPKAWVRGASADVKQVCSRNAGRMVSPITVAIVSAEDGRGTSARIEIVPRSVIQ